MQTHMHTLQRMDVLQLHCRKSAQVLMRDSMEGIRDDVDMLDHRMQCVHCMRLLAAWCFCVFHFATYGWRVALLAE